MQPDTQMPPKSVPELMTVFGNQWDWPSKPFEASAKWYAEALSFTARSLQAEADLLSAMAAANDPSEMMKRYSDFVQVTWDSYAKELSKAVALVTAAGIPAKRGN